MKLAVINGSPKGEKSVTLQHLRWWQAAGGAAELEVIHVSLEILALTRSTARLAPRLTPSGGGCAYLVHSGVSPSCSVAGIQFVEACGAEEDRPSVFLPSFVPRSIITIPPRRLAQCGFEDG